MAAISAAPYLAGCSLEGNRKLKDFGFISGIIKDDLNEDWKSALEKVAGFGYTEIETGNFLGESASSYLDFLKQTGLKAIAGGTRLYEDKDELNNSLDTLNELELEYAVAYWPWLVGAPFSLDDCKRSVELLNSIGEECKSRGLKLLWHNHDNEFIEMGEGLPFDYLMDHTDPELVNCEMDVYWVKKGGADPLEMLKKYEGRYPVLHIKDMAPGEEQDFACVGDGIVDFPSIFAESYRQGIKHFNVERDKAPDGMGCLESASVYLKEVRF